MKLCIREMTMTPDKKSVAVWDAMVASPDVNRLRAFRLVAKSQTALNDLTTILARFTECQYVVLELDRSSWEILVTGPREHLIRAVEVLIGR